MDYIIAIQNMTDNYSKLKGKKSAKEFLFERGTHEVPGILTAHHKLILQSMISEYALANGIDINEEIMKNEGVKRVPTVLSKTEMSYIDKLLKLEQIREENIEKVA